MKQFVTEKWYGNHVEITLDYKEDEQISLMKEREELISILPENRKVIRYWVRVASDPTGAKRIFAERFIKESKRSKERKTCKARLSELHREKDERIARYAERIALGKPIRSSKEDKESAKELQRLTNRKMDLKKLLVP